MQLYTGWNDKIVALEKTTSFHFRLMKTGFLFCCRPSTTNPNSDSRLLSCLKVTQCSTSEIGDALLFNLCLYRSNRTIASTLKIQIWIATNNRDVPRVMKTKFPARVMVYGVVSSETHIMPPHIFAVGLVIRRELHQHDLPQHQSQPDRRHLPSILRASAGACGKGMLPVPDPYRGGDWGWRRLYWIGASYCQHPQNTNLDFHE